MTYLYIKPEVKKYDTTAMTTAINEACAGNCYFVRGYFWSPLLQGFSQTAGLGKGVGQSIHSGDNKQTKKKNIFSKMGNTRVGGIIQGDNYSDIVLQ